jgi:Fur family ferric uptake transcriptional regulator
LKTGTTTSTSSSQNPGDDEPGDPGTFEGALSLLRQHGGRITSSRRFLLRVFFEEPGHHTAEELAAAVQAQAPDIHISTIYRNLDELERLGVIVHSHLGHGAAAYHLAGTSHGHLVCESCGKMIEAPEGLFRGLAKAARAEFDFAIDPHHFAVLGVCSDCRAANPPDFVSGN